MDKPARLLVIARQIANSDARFADVRGPSEGNLAHNAFMAALRAEAELTFRQDHAEQHLCGDNDLAVDFYFADDATIVEIALGLPNPNTEFEKDILKALLAKRHGHKVQRLFFISRPGAQRKCSQGGRAAMIQWARTVHKLAIEIHELDGERRVRARRRRGRTP